jgi:hypothetical protein
MAPDSGAFRDEVLALLRRFQEGYTRRDVRALDDFMQLFAEGAELIGTSAVTPGVEEWCLGRDSIRELIKEDWETWGDVLLDLGRATTDVRGETAWVAVPGVVSEMGETRPLRLTAVLVREERRWLIHQMHFSLATTGGHVVRSR